MNLQYYKDRAKALARDYEAILKCSTISFDILDDLQNYYNIEMTSCEQSIKALTAKNDNLKEGK